MEILYRCRRCGHLFRQDEREAEVCPRCGNRNCRVIQRFY